MTLFYAKDNEGTQTGTDDKSTTGNMANKDDQTTDQKKRKGGYDFRCGQVLMATPYGQRQLVLHGRTPEEIRQAFGFSPEFMAECFRVALQAQPLNKDFEPFTSAQDYR